MCPAKEGAVLTAVPTDSALSEINDFVVSTSRCVTTNLEEVLRVLHEIELLVDMLRVVDLACVWHQVRLIELNQRQVSDYPEVDGSHTRRMLAS